jgi:hypothetical protein
MSNIWFKYERHNTMHRKINTYINQVLLMQKICSNLRINHTSLDTCVMNNRLKCINSSKNINAQLLKISEKQDVLVNEISDMKKAINLMNEQINGLSKILKSHVSTNIHMVNANIVYDNANISFDVD